MTRRSLTTMNSQFCPFAAGRRSQRQLDAFQHHRVVDRVGKDASHGALGHHRFEQRHVQAGKRLGCGRHDRGRTRVGEPESGMAVISLRLRSSGAADSVAVDPVVRHAQ